MKWENENGQIILREDNKVRAVISKREDVKPRWSVNFYCIDEFYTIEANTLEEAEWEATNLLYNRCNEKANYYHRIRDHLPSIHDLAKKAGIV